MSLKEKIINWVLEGFLKTFSTGEVTLRARIALWFAGRKLNSYFKEAEKMETKRWWQSRTIWANTLIGIASVVTALVKDGGLDPKTIGILGGVSAVINIVLRFITDTGIETGK